MLNNIVHFGAVVVLAWFAGVTQAFNADVSDPAALQRGAKLYMSYCSGCHSLKYMRYDSLAKGIAVSKDLVIANLMFSGNNNEAKISDPIKSAMSSKDAVKWFGIIPPDLSLVARSRGTDWLYEYLRSFYNDPTRPWGVNNKTFPDVAMPHVLANQQNMLSDKAYNKLVADLVTFLSYVGEPHQLQRQKIGVWVLLFLSILLVFTFLLKREYWKNIK